ncbi:proliferating cell nuclear antigen (pcna) [Candidatus Woesearchaeota archaeon]|nr:proliferating cell nuclear antigen (pcna) [Candidatus Woesearchaeota archaeon]MBI2661502.1 proliferating cell nuclear antigen (pcna) [Candidatus Woesearchaeota archaeon]
MRLTLAEPRYLKESISIISDLVNEARFRITPNSIELVAMDPANVSMVIFKLLSSSFIEYNVEKDIDFAINLSNLKQVLRRAAPNDMLTLELGEDNRMKVLLKSNTARTFSIPLIDLEEKEQKIPNLKFDVTIRTASNVLTEAITDADVVGESVTFSAAPKKFTIHAEGDLTEARIEIKEGENTKVSVTGDNEIKSKYSIEYLKKMVGAAKLADEVNVYFNKDYPLKLEYKTVDKLNLSFILAPRVEND